MVQVWTATELVEEEAAVVVVVRLRWEELLIAMDICVLLSPQPDGPLKLNSPSSSLLWCRLRSSGAKVLGVVGGLGKLSHDVHLTSPPVGRISPTAPFFQFFTRSSEQEDAKSGFVDLKLIRYVHTDWFFSQQESAAKFGYLVNPIPQRKKIQLHHSNDLPC